MKRLIVGIIGMAMLASAAPAHAGLTEAAELEHARANARAGGPIAERDAELLHRYGCASGTRSSFCERMAHHHRWRHAQDR
jgi:hypothetical protein